MKQHFKNTDIMMLLAKTIISSKIILGPALKNNVKWSFPKCSQRTLDNQLSHVIKQRTVLRITT
jgi:hypothetical protein